MNIGMLAGVLPYLPARDGFRLYSANILRALSPRHRIDLVAVAGDDDLRHLDWARERCASVTVVPVEPSSVGKRLASLVSSHVWGRPRHYRVAVETALMAGLASRRWDVLHVEGGFVAGLVPADIPVASVLSVHDSWTLRCDEILRCRPGLRDQLYYRLLRHHEPRYQRLVYPRFDQCVVVGPRDAEAVRSTVPDVPVAVIPSGIDTSYFQPLPAVREDEATLVFHGDLGYPPNVDAALVIADQIFPLVRSRVPQATLRLVGANPAPAVMTLGTRPGISVSANLPDLRAAVGSASVYVAAVRHGTGVKNKVLEAMALGLPIVCFPAAAAGIECTAGKELLVGHDVTTLAHEIVGLLSDPAQRAAIGAAARAVVVERHSWESRAGRFEEVYAAAIGHRSRGTSPSLSTAGVGSR